MDDPRSNMEFDHGRVEARSVAFTDVDASTDGSTFTGYAAVFDHEADLGDFTESISRGAFRKAIGGSGNIPMLYDHNPGLPVLATTGAGTLKLKEDGKGLRVEANVARHFIGDAVREMVPAATFAA
jgi:HK97 family phage prohead protease